MSNPKLLIIAYIDKTGANVEWLQPLFGTLNIQFCRNVYYSSESAITCTFLI